MALSHKDWELPNSRNGYWPRSRFSHPDRKSRKLKCKIIDCFHLAIFISVNAKSWWEKKNNWEDEQTLEELNLTHRRSQAKCQLVRTSYLKRIKLFLFLPYIKHLINWAKSVCMEESWPRSCVQTSLRSVFTYDLGQDSPIQTSWSVNKSTALYFLQNSFIWSYSY